MNDSQLMEMMIEVRDTVRDLKHANDQMHGDVVRLRRIITGESEPERGLALRVDRLEQRQERSSFLSQTAIGAALTAVIGAIIAAIGFKQ
jgi:hypothetical protein